MESAAPAASGGDASAAFTSPTTTTLLRLEVVSLLQRPAPARSADAVAAVCCPWESVAGGERNVIVCDHDAVLRVDCTTNRASRRGGIDDATRCTALALSPSGRLLFATFRDDTRQSYLSRPSRKSTCLRVFDAHTMMLMYSRTGRQFPFVLFGANDGGVRIVPSHDDRTVALIDAESNCFLLNTENSMQPLVTAWCGNADRRAQKQRRQQMTTGGDDSDDDDNERGFALKAVFAAAATCCAFDARTNGDLFTLCAATGSRGRHVVRLLSMANVYDVSAAAASQEDNNNHDDDDDDDNPTRRNGVVVVHRRWPIAREYSPPTAVCFSPSGSRIAVAAVASVFMFCVPTGVVLTRLDQYPARIASMAWVPVGGGSREPSWGRIIAVSARPATTRVTVWEQTRMAVGRAFQIVADLSLSRHYSTISASADGTHFVLGGGCVAQQGQPQFVPVFRLGAAEAEGQQEETQDVDVDGSSDTCTGAAAAAASRWQSFCDLPAELGGEGRPRAVVATVAGRRGRGGKR